MTREEMLEKSSKAPYDIRTNIDKFINIIYDDFESRTCTNCEYSIDVGDNNMVCTMLGVTKPSHFSCSDFKKGISCNH